MMGAGTSNGMGLGWIWPVVLVLGVAAFVWGLMRARSSAREEDERQGEGGAAGEGAGSARDILRARFARGEISEDELRERLKVLDER
jgi:putative membrane protein